LNFTSEIRDLGLRCLVLPARYITRSLRKSSTSPASILSASLTSKSPAYFLPLVIESILARTRAAINSIIAREADKHCSGGANTAAEPRWPFALGYHQTHRCTQPERPTDRDGRDCRRIVERTALHAARRRRHSATAYYSMQVVGSTPAYFVPAYFFEAVYQNDRVRQTARTNSGGK